MPTRFAGRCAAFSLTYDDALPEHREATSAQLAAAGLTATFYLPAGWTAVLDHADAWRTVAAAGHELGNHTAFHPCRRDMPGRDWVPTAYDLATYDRRRFDDEIRTANALLAAIDGRRARSYGNTCHEDTVGSGERAFRVRDAILAHCIAARGPCTGAAVDAASADRGALGCISGDGRRASDLLAIADTAIAEGAWAILCIHGVGPAHHHLCIDDAEHTALIAGLRERRDDLWTASVAEVAATLG